MIKRFRLEQKSHYERLVVAQRLSEMLVNFLDGRPTPLSIGVEQGGIEEWDDVVIYHSAESIEHLQVKRQTRPFCTKDSDKAKYLTKPSKAKSAANSLQILPGQPPLPSKPPLKAKKPTQIDSVLDSAFASLAKHASKGTFSLQPDRQFSLAIMSPGLLVKSELTLDHVDQLCRWCRQPGVNLTDLANSTDGPTKRAYSWLRTWCGFQDWAQIRDILSRVTIICPGNDAALEQRGAAAFSRHFTNPKRAFGRLLTYITKETSHISTLGCADVLKELRDELRPDIETWAQYLLGDNTLSSGKSWSFSGTHDLGGMYPKAAQGVVEHMWSDQPGHRRLRIHAPYTPPTSGNLTLTSALLRLALHLPISSQGLMLGEASWRSNVLHEAGYTFGCAENDLRYLPWLDNSEPLKSALDSEFKSMAAARNEAQELAGAMDEVVWKRLVAGVFEKLKNIADPALADAMEVVWEEWLVAFTDHPESRRAFLNQLLYPETEGKNSEHALRIGLRTLELLVNAVETLLLVAVGIGGSGNSWESFPQCGQVLSLALKYWSGPAGSTQYARELSDDTLTSIIGKCPAPVVILSGVSASHNELLGTGLADDAEAPTSMAAERQPQLLVTRSNATRQHLLRGNLASVRQHFTKQWQERQLAREAAIENKVKGL